MSAYAQFFIRRGDEFIPIGEYSRNSIIYKLVNPYAPWGKIAPLSYDALIDLINHAEEHKKNYEQAIQEMKEKMARVKELTDKWEEAISYLEDREESIKEYEEDIAEATYAIHFFGFLEDIIETIRYSNKYIFDKYIYVGIEIGYPTVKDIEV